jgi:hypothetical protein
MHGYAGRVLRVNFSRRILPALGGTEAGIPSREKLRELGLGSIVKDIEPFRRKTRNG